MVKNMNNFMWPSLKSRHTSKVFQRALRKRVRKAVDNIWCDIAQRQHWDELIDALYDLYRAAIDAHAPEWFRRHSEALFTLIEMGTQDLVWRIQSAKAQINRNPEFEGDEVGRWHD